MVDAHTEIFSSCSFTLLQRYFHRVHITLKIFSSCSHYFKDIFIMFILLLRYFHHVHITSKIFSKYIFIIFTLRQGYFPHQLIFSYFCTCNQTETFSSRSHYIGNTFHTDWYLAPDHLQLLKWWILAGFHSSVYMSSTALRSGLGRDARKES